MLAVLAVLLAAAPGAAPSPSAAVPVLVELFTSEGCSSCPPADAALARLVEEQPVAGARVVALGEHVDYWDDLGWKDRYSSRLFSERQGAYVQRLRLGGAYTPQLVAGGRFQAIGGDAAAVRAAVAAAARAPAGTMALRLAQAAEGAPVLDVEATWPGGATADVLLAAVEERATSVVTRGENAGRTLTHVAVVRAMRRVGSGAGTFSGRATLDGLRSPGATRVVAFVQERGGGPVRAVGAIDVP